jgi:hypothetical protein
MTTILLSLGLILLIDGPIEALPEKIKASETIGRDVFAHVNPLCGIDR